MNQEIILPEDPRAAVPHTMTGWKSMDGRFYGPNDERLARWNSATHVRCEHCQAITEKGYTACGDCRHKRDLERYAKRERKEWDGVQMVYSESRDKYYSSPDDAFEDQDGDDEQVIPVDLRLRLCDPQKAHLSSDTFASDLPEGDDEIPVELADAIDAFNKAMENVVLSWVPGKYALKID